MALRAEERKSEIIGSICEQLASRLPDDDHALADRFALIVQLLAPRQPYLDFGSPPHEVYLQGDEGQALLRHFAPQPRYLLRVE
jgi:hypothetical protein